MITLKIIFFSFLLCFVVVKLPFMISVNKITGFTQSSLVLLRNETIDDNEKSSQLRQLSMWILLETLKIAFWLTVFVLSAMGLWTALNFNDGLTLASFDVLLTAKGILLSCVGILIYVGFKKLVKVARGL